MIAVAVDYPDWYLTKECVFRCFRSHDDSLSRITQWECIQAFYLTTLTKIVRIVPQRVTTDILSISALYVANVFRFYFDNNPSFLQVLHDVCDEDGVDTVVITHNGSATLKQDECEHAHSLRIRALTLSDPVHKVSLLDCARDQLEKVKSRFQSVDYFQQLLTSVVDGQVLQELNDFLRHNS